MEKCYCCMQAVQDGAETCPHCHSPLTSLPQDPTDLMPGTRLGPDGRYEVGLRVQRQGALIVYHALDTQQNKYVWVYELMPADLCYRPEGSREPVMRPGAFARLFADRMRLLQFQYQYMERLVDVPQAEKPLAFFQENRTCYLVTSGAQGERLDVYLARRGGRLSEREVHALAEQMLTTLSVMHKANLLHRNLHLQHFYLNSKNRLTLTGFSCTVVLPAVAAMPPLVDTGFLAPEQQHGMEEAPCTDVYAAACCIRALLGGDTQTASAQMKQALEKALLRQPDQRYRTGEEFLLAVAPNAAKQKKRNTTYTVPPEAPHFKEKKKKGGKVFAVLFAVLALVCVVAGGVWAYTTFLMNRVEEVWPQWPAEIAVNAGDVVWLDVPVKAELPPMELTSGNKALFTAWVSGKQLVLRGEQAGQTTLTITRGENSHTMRVKVNAAEKPLYAGSVTLYTNATKQLHVGDDVKAYFLEQEQERPGDLTIVTSGDLLIFKAGMATGGARLHLQRGNQSSEILVMVVPSPYESYMMGFGVESLEVFVGEKAEVPLRYEGIDVGPLTLEGTQFFSVAQVDNHLVVEGLGVTPKRQTQYLRVSDGSRTFQLPVAVLPTLESMTNEVEFYADKRGVAEMTPRGGTMPDISIVDGSNLILLENGKTYAYPLADGKTLNVQQNDKKLVFSAGDALDTTIKFSDGRKVFEVKVKVNPTPNIADLSELPEKRELVEGTSEPYTIKAVSGNVPDIKVTCEKGEKVAKLTWNNPQLTVTALTPGESVYLIEDGENKHRMTIIVTRKPNDLLGVSLPAGNGRDASLSDQEKAQYTDVLCLDAAKDQTVKLKIDSVHGTMENMKVTIDSAAKVEHQFNEKTKELILTGLTMDPAILSIEAPNREYQCYIEVFDCLKAKPSWIKKVALKGDQVCKLPFESYYGTIVPQVSCESDMVDIETAKDHVLIYPAAVGETTVNIKLEDFEHSIAVTVTDSLKEDPDWAKEYTLDLGSEIRLTYATYFGTLEPEISASMSVLDIQKNAGELVIKGKKPADAAKVTVKLDGKTYETKFNVCSRLTDLKFKGGNSLVSGQPGEILMVCEYTNGELAKLTVQEDATKSFRIEQIGATELKLITTGVTKSGSVIVTDGRTPYEVPYEVVEVTPTPSPKATKTPVPTTAKPTASPTPAKTEPKLQAEDIQVLQAVMTSRGIFLLDGNNGKVIKATADGKLDSSYMNLGKSMKLYTLRQGDGIIYGLGEQGKNNRGKVWIESAAADNYTDDLGSLWMNIWYGTDVQLTGEGIMILQGGECTNYDGSVFYTEYQPLNGRKGAEVAYSRGSAAFWEANNPEEELRPLWANKNKPMTNITAVAMHGSYGAAVVESPGNEGKEGKLFFFGAVPEEMKKLLGVAAKAGNVLTQFNNLSKETLAGNDILSETGAPLSLISLSARNVAAITDSGKVIMGGANDKGQLGQTDADANKNVKALIPVDLDLGGDRPKEVFCLNNYTLLLTENGYLYGWGANDNCQLGVARQDIMPPTLLLNGVKSFTPSQGEMQVLVTTDHRVVVFGGGKTFQYVTLK